MTARSVPWPMPVKASEPWRLTSRLATRVLAGRGVFGGDGKAGNPGGDGDDDRANGPEAFEHDQPAAAIFGRQELGHHGVVDGERATDGNAGHEAQEEQDEQVWRKDREQAENGVAGHGDDEDTTAAEAIGETAKEAGADQHA